MKESLVNRHPLLFTFGLGLILTIGVAGAGTISTILELGDNGTLAVLGIPFLLMGVLITLYISKSRGGFEPFGFVKVEVQEARQVLYYLPLLAIAFVYPLLGGLKAEMPWSEIIIILVFAFFVGYTEEAIFRGIYKEKLLKKGVGFFLLFSSGYFGILHAANALTGKDLTAVILQVTNAFLVGLILSLLLLILPSIIPLIAFHFLYDALALMTGSGAEQRH
ncbi:MAG: CPBP family glutamic-type intramembrane protease, partial [Bacillota bacterium]